MGPQCVDFANLKLAATPVFNNDANPTLPDLKRQMNAILVQAAAIVTGYPDPPPSAAAFDSELGVVVDQINAAESGTQVYSLVLAYLRQYGQAVDEIVASLVATCRFPDEPTMVRPAAEVSRWLEERAGPGA
jgi:hypothetical protein